MLKVALTIQTADGKVHEVDLTGLVSEAVKEKGKPADTSSLWEDLRDHPEGWVDNRQKKADNPKLAKIPDFKRGSDGAALWLNNRNTPDWAKEMYG